MVLSSPVKPADLAGGDIAAPLGHKPNAPLRVLGLVRVDVVDEGRLGGDLKVSDDTVALAAQVDKVGVRVVDGKHHPIACVQLHHHDRVVQVTCR